MGDPGAPTKDLNEVHQDAYVFTFLFFGLDQRNPLKEEISKKRTIVFPVFGNSF